MSIGELQHRIFLAPARPAVAWAEAQAHWRSHHLAITVELPHLIGYVQNRPHPDWWVHLPYLACSETWFASRESEREAFASDWYRDVMAVDEARMFAREDAWSSPVTSLRTLRPGPLARFRTLAFGASPEMLKDVLHDGRAELLSLLRPPPMGGACTVVAVWSDEAELARHLAVRLGGLTFVAEPVAPLRAPSPPWIESAPALPVAPG